MLSVQDIERAIAQLSPEQEKELRQWLADRDWAAWDRQIEDDLAAGRLDAIIAEVDEEIDAGRYTKLCRTTRYAAFGRTTIDCPRPSNERRIAVSSSLK